MDFIRSNLPKALIPHVDQLPGVDFHSLLSGKGLSPERIEVLQNVVRGEQEIDDVYALLDVHLFAIKVAFPSEYEVANVPPHDAASKHLVTYDPQKNGHNLIKHGLAFGETYSFSKDFGTLMVPCPNERDGERVAIFSKLVVPEGSALLLPTGKIKDRSDLCTMTSATVTDEGFRFITSRAFDRDTWQEALNNAAAKIYPDKADSATKKKFIEECDDLVRAELFDVRDGESPIRIVRPNH